MANIRLVLFLVGVTLVSHIYANTFVKTGIWLNNVENEDGQLVCTVTCQDTPIPTPPPHQHPGGDCNDTDSTPSPIKKPCGCHNGTTSSPLTTSQQQPNTTTSGLPVTTTTVNVTLPGTMTTSSTTALISTTTAATSTKNTTLPSTSSTPLTSTNLPPTTCQGAGKKSSCFNGDPHYGTFDGSLFDYQGTCPYIFSKPCTEIDGINNFVLKAKSRRWHKTTVSVIESINFEMYGLNIYMDFDGILFVNQIQQQYPYNFPDQINPKLVITRNGLEKVITTSDGIVVTFDNMVLCISIPDCMPFYGNDKLCGIAGNYDDKCANDLVYKNGTQVSNQKLPCNYGDTVSNWGNDWITTDYFTPAGTTLCERGEDNQTPTDCETGKTTCALIQQAQTGAGVFAKCKDLKADVFSSYFTNCVSDVCASADLKCSALESFAKLCQQELKVDLTNWRNSVNCPYFCPANSTYNSNVLSGQPTCTSASVPATTTTSPAKTASEGCMCNPGYVIDPSKFNFTCILQEDCACIDEFGVSHTSLNDPWVSKNCSFFNHCYKGKQISRPTHCYPDEQCVVEEKIESCQSNKCPKGWTFFSDTKSCYKTIYDVSSVTGEAECIKQGGHLASIHSNVENNVVLNMIYLSATPLGFSDYTVFGWNGDLENRWLDGTPNDYYSATKAPNNQTRCMMMRTEPVEGLWVFSDCNVKQRSGVCKKPAQ